MHLPDGHVVFLGIDQIRGLRVNAVHVPAL
jgi:hypothetical protein